MRKTTILLIVIVLLMVQPMCAYAEPIKGKLLSSKMIATYYLETENTGAGAGGRLVNGKTIALNNIQRKAWGLRYGDRVYIDFPRRFDSLDGWWIIRDSGCRRMIIDLYYTSSRYVPKRLRSAGIVRGTKIYAEKQISKKEMEKALKKAIRRVKK